MLNYTIHRAGPLQDCVQRCVKCNVMLPPPKRTRKIDPDQYREGTYVGVSESLVFVLGPPDIVPCLDEDEKFCV